MVEVFHKLAMRAGISGTQLCTLDSGEGKPLIFKECKNQQYKNLKQEKKCMFGEFEKG